MSDSESSSGGSSSSFDPSAVRTDARGRPPLDDALAAVDAAEEAEAKSQQLAALLDKATAYSQFLGGQLTQDTYAAVERAREVRFFQFFFFFSAVAISNFSHVVLGALFSLARAGWQTQGVADTSVSVPTLRAAQPALVTGGTLRDYQARLVFLLIFFFFWSRRSFFCSPLRFRQHCFSSKYVFMCIFTCICISLCINFAYVKKNCAKM